MVRLFPRATRLAPGSRCRPRAALAATLVGLVGMTGASLGATAMAADLDDKRDEVEEKIDEAHDHLDESSAQLQAATEALLRAQDELDSARAHLAETRGELAVARARDREMQAKLEKAIERLKAARADLAQGRADVAAQEAELRQVVVNTYEQGDPALMGLSMVLTTADPTDLAERMNANSSVVNAESSALDRLEAAKVLLTVQEEELEAAKKDVAERRRAAARNLEVKKELEQQAEEAEAEVSKLVDLHAQARRTAVEAKNADLAELAKLQAERDRIERLIVRQASVSYGPVERVAGGGFLSAPVDGYLTSPFGMRVHPVWGYRSLHDGVDFGAGCGSPIRASAGGRVLSTYYQSAWGNRVIVDHGVHRGVGVATISNHLSRFAVRPGQQVRRGQVIGYVGSTGWSTGCHLHFTVLQNGAPVNPMNWL